MLLGASRSLAARLPCTEDNDRGNFASRGNKTCATHAEFPSNAKFPRYRHGIALRYPRTAKRSLSPDASATIATPPSGDTVPVGGTIPRRRGLRHGGSLATR